MEVQGTAEKQLSMADVVIPIKKSLKSYYFKNLYSFMVHYMLA